jgi:peptide/nickel transport system substrate-binding protein
MCKSYVPGTDTFNAAAFCDHKIDAMIARASRLQTEDPAAASRLWSNVDRAITNAAPWVTMSGTVTPDFLSRRTGNYTPCYLSLTGGSTSACLDQLWVR